MTVPHRVADLHLRGRDGPLRVRAYWPEPAARPPALLVFFPDGDDLVCRELCVHAGLVVLAVLAVHAVTVHDARAATEWAAAHAAELSADPDRLLVGGDGTGATLAAAVARHARDLGWPAIAHQILLGPTGTIRPPDPNTTATGTS